MGGTIEFHDPAYEAINQTLMKLDSSVDSYLHNLIKPHFTFSTETVTKKDSRDITPEDREKLAKAIESTSYTNILVTHGTFTMADTAQYLKKQGTGAKKVILTGSMIPITGFAASDAGFNIGFAIAAFSSLDQDVYLAMNGGIFKASEATKNIEKFRFE